MSVLLIGKMMRKRIYGLVLPKLSNRMTEDIIDRLTKNILESSMYTHMPALNRLGGVN